MVDLGYLRNIHTYVGTLLILIPPKNAGIDLIQIRTRIGAVLQLPPYNGQFSNGLIYENFENHEPFSKINFHK